MRTMTEKKNRMKPLYMPLYVEKFFADTIHFNPTEGWAYINLLCAMWRSEDGTLPNEADKLARAGRIHRPHWSRIWSAIKEQFDIDADRVTNTHLQAELGKANARIVVARAKASMGGRVTQVKRVLNGNQHRALTAPKPLENNNGVPIQPIAATHSANFSAGE